MTIMASGLNSLDPQWAWSAYEPDSARPWNRALAAHLYRRAGFGADWATLDRAASRTPAEAIESLFAPVSETGLQSELDALASAVLASKEPKKLSAWWLHAMLRTPDVLREKLTLFWHGHFATSGEKVQDSTLMHRQNQLFRRHALGAFEELVQGVSRDPAMLIYLDSAVNRKAHPNENYAREVMELFCLDEGNYTEADIREAARCFTGWEVRRGKFYLNRRQVDHGEKKVLGRTGAFGGEDVVRVILDHAAAPRFIARKLVHYLVCDEPAASDALIEPLAEDFRESGLDVGRLVRRIISSELFFSEHAVGRKIRAPVELGVGLMRTLEGSCNVFKLGEELAALGQELFYPPNVKGWDGGRTWINSSTLLGRASLLPRLLADPNTRFAGGDLETLAEQHNLTTLDAAVAWMAEALLAVTLPRQVKERIVALSEAAPGGRSAKLAAALEALAALPEFQLA
jgi:uncharacterized protein (DUF1800 family)